MYHDNSLTFWRSISRSGQRLLTVFIICLVSALVLIGYKLYFDPSVYYLSSKHHSAQWIVFDEPFDVVARPVKSSAVVFKSRFSRTGTTSADLTLTAFKYARVFVNDRPVFETPPDPAKWKNTYRVDLGGLPPGEYELSILVVNNEGPPAVIAYSDALKIVSGENWQATRDNKTWSPAVPASHQRSPQFVSRFPSPGQSLVNTLPATFTAVLFLAALFWFLKYRQLNNPVGILRYVLLGVWLVILLNGLLRARLMGFDFTDHVAYIDFVASNWRIPLASQGLQMFQSPLYYMIAALMFRVLNIFLDVNTSFHMLVLIPLVCGMLNLELCYRIGRTVFPERQDLQLVVMLVGGFMPMNLYMSQYVGNEMLAGTLTCLSILIFIRWLKNIELSRRPRQAIYLGIGLGAALLAKVTAVLLLLPMLAIYVYAGRKQDVSVKQISIVIARVGAVIFLVAGWYYIRNWILQGQPFIGGWDSERGIAWWQHPGYRTIHDFVSFGTSIFHPVYAATQGFWDSIYSTMWTDGLLGGVSNYASRPPWNYSYMMTLAWFSLLPSAGIIAGMLSVLRRANSGIRQISVFFVLCVVVYLGAIAYLYLHLPIYSTAKASYSLGLLPCYAVMCALGLKPLMDKNNIIKWILLGLLTVWSVFSVAAFFRIA